MRKLFAIRLPSEAFSLKRIGDPKVDFRHGVAILLRREPIGQLIIGPIKIASTVVVATRADQIRIFHPLRLRATNSLVPLFMEIERQIVWGVFVPVEYPP